MENLNENLIEEINIKNDFIKVNEVFTFITHNHIRINAICMCLCDTDYVDALNLVDNTYLCYSQNRLFYIHQRHDLAVREYVIKDLNQTLVNYCIIPEYDIKLKEYAEHNFFYGGAE